MTAVDDYTVEFDLKEPDAVLDVALADIAIMDNDTLATVNQTPNGSGSLQAVGIRSRPERQARAK